MPNWPENTDLRPCQRTAAAQTITEAVASAVRAAEVIAREGGG